MGIKLSALDIVPVFEGDTPKDALDRSLHLAQALEKMGFERFLVAEHHNLGGTASSSTSNVIQYILSNTSTIRVGAGGVMLPNHSPLQVAETYGTLDALYPGRVDLGIGRAPGTDPQTAQLITRKNYFSNQDFFDDVQLIEFFLGPLSENSIIGAYPGVNSEVPIIILGSSVNSAYVAAELGVMYAFAGHINPRDAKKAIEIYRERFKPSDELSEPYVILGTWLFAADTDQRADQLYSSTQRRFLKMLSGEKGKYERPENIERELTSAEKLLLTKRMGMNVKGSVDTMVPQIREIIEKYNPDEIIAVTSISEDQDLARAYELLKEAVQKAEQ